MKPWLIDAAAFVIGVIIAFMQGGLTTDLPWSIRFGLELLCPGYIAGLPFVFLVQVIGLFSIGFYFLICILVNGLIFGLASYLIRQAAKGQRLARLALAIGMGAWATWGAVHALRAWPWPDPPPAPVDFSSPLAGRWNGVLHAERGDRAIVLVCHPRTDGTLGGYLYVHGWDMGPFENGVHARDSLRFEIVGFEYSAHYDDNRMSMAITVSGMSHAGELRFVSADTTRPVPAPVDLGSPLAGRWDGVLPVRSRDLPFVLILHPHTDQTLDGTLYLAGAEMGPFEGGLWAADSLHFEIAGFRYNAHFDSTKMSMKRSGRGLNQSIALRFVGADTTRPAVPPNTLRVP